MVVKDHTLAFKPMASTEVWEEMSGGDTSTAGDGSIVAGTGVDVVQNRQGRKITGGGACRYDQ